MPAEDEIRTRVVEVLLSLREPVLQRLADRLPPDEPPGSLTVHRSLYDVLCEEIWNPNPRRTVGEIHRIVAVADLRRRVGSFLRGQIDLWVLIHRGLREAGITHARVDVVQGSLQMAGNSGDGILGVLLDMVHSRDTSAILPEWTTRIGIGRAYRESHLLQVMIREILELRDPDAMYAVLERSILDIFALRGLSIAGVNPAGNCVEILRAFPNGPGPSNPIGWRFELSHPDILCQVARTGRMEVIDGPDPRYHEQVTGPDGERIIRPRGPAHNEGQTAYFLPIVAKGRVIGVVSAGSAASERDRTLLELERMRPFLDQIGSAILMASEIAERRRVEAALRDSEAKYRAIVTVLPDIVYRLDPEGRIIFINDAVRAYGLEPDEMIGRSILEFVHPADRDRSIYRMNERRTGERRTRSFEVRLFPAAEGDRTFEVRDRVLDGAPVFLVEAEGLYQTDRPAAGVFVGTQGLARDITERRMTEGALRASEDKFAKAFHSSPHPKAISTLEEGRYVEANESFLRFMGYEREELLGRTSGELGVFATSTDRARLLRDLKEQGTLRGVEARINTRTRGVRDCRISVELIEIGGESCLLSEVEDITVAIQVEREREATIQLFKLLQEANDTPELLRAVTSCMQAWTGCESVGVRLRDGDDYPYFSTRGFSSEFVALESRLCTADPDGQPARDDNGLPVLDCMCGHVLRGRFDPTRPYFTDHGSFWTNSTTEFLASLTEAERQARTRNRCHSDGYESVALIPLRHGQTTYGLLQINDRRKDRFTERHISFLEGLAGSIAISLAQHQARRDLQASEQRFRTVANFTCDWETWIGPDHSMKYSSPAAERITGYRAEEFVEDPDLLARIAHPEDHDAVIAHYRDMHPAEIGNTGLEFRILRRDGEERWLQHICQPVYGEMGECLGRRGSHRDITDHKRREADLFRLNTAIDQAAESILMTDAGGCILYANPACERTSGYSRQELIGQNPRILKSGKHDASFYRRMWDTLSRGESWIGRITNRHKDGTLYEVDRVISPVRDENGEVIFYIGSGRDVTNEVALEEQLRQSQKMEAIGVLAGGVAHDFNNLLTVINGHAKMLLRRFGEGDPARDGLKEIQKSGDRATGLTRQLLAFSRRQVLRVEVLDLSTLIQNLARMLRRIIGEDVEMVTDLAEDLWAVEVDPGQFEQVILNLTVNARDAMPEGGMLRIEARNVELDESRPALELAPGTYVVLSIQDTGVGMDPQTQARIFDPFFTTKPKGKGTGLGLSMVYGIVKQSKGAIEVESEAGRGSVFRVYLPRSAGDGRVFGGGEDPSSAVESGITGSETLLLVEDEAMLLGLEGRALAEAGYRVLQAKDGLEAVQISEQHQGAIDLLVTDVVMPGMSGRELAEQVRRVRPGLRVLFVSGYTDDAVIRHGVRTSGMEFLPKPFTPDDLMRKIRAVIDRGSWFREPTGEARPAQIP